MDASKTFDPYETVGIITPGTIVALLLASEAPLFRSLMGGQGITIGGFGLFVLFAFVFGQLIQALGNLIEFIVWPRVGLPTNMVTLESQTLISSGQRKLLAERVAAMEGEALDLSKAAPAEWRAITARAYTRVNAAGRSAKIDISNRTYGLCRGLVAATTATLLWCLYEHRDQISLLIVLALMITAAVWRMRRAGIHYARTLFLAFIDLEPNSASAV